MKLDGLLSDCCIDPTAPGRFGFDWASPGTLNNTKDNRMRHARAAAPSVCSSRALHIFRVATGSDIPDAQTAYAKMVDGGEIHPDARVMVIVASGYRGALSPPRPPALVRDVVVHVVRS